MKIIISKEDVIRLCDEFMDNYDTVEEDARYIYTEEFDFVGKLYRILNTLPKNAKISMDLMEYSRLAILKK